MALSKGLMWLGIESEPKRRQEDGQNGWHLLYTYT